MKKIQNILFGLSAITGVLFLVGCNEITKEVDKGFVIIGEQTQKWNLETCGTYKMQYQEIPKEKQDLFLADFIKQEKEYEVFWYEKEKRETKKGEEILKSFPEAYDHSYDDMIELNTCKHTSATEMFGIYNYSQSMFYWTPKGFGIDALMHHDISRISQNSMLEQEWEFATRADIKKQAQELFARYGIQVAENMDIYAVSREELVNYHIEGWENYAENTGDAEEFETKEDIHLIEDCYVIKAYIMAEGIRVMDNQNINYAEDENYRKIPELTLIYTKDGVQNIDIRHYMQLGEKIEERKIISYEEAEQIVLGQYKGIESEAERYEYHAGELVYLPQEDKKDMIAIPVWEFKGVKTKEYEGVEYESDCTVFPCMLEWRL